MVKKKSSIVPKKRIIFIVLILIIVGFFFGYREYLKSEHPISYAGYVEKYAKENNLDPLLIYSIISVESGFDEKAVSHVGARGLMQIMDETYDWIKFKMGESTSKSYDDMFNPEYNIKYGCFLMGLLMEEFEGNIPTSMAAYHAGRGQVNKWLSDPEYSSNGNDLDKISIADTQHYVDKINNAYEFYKKLYEE